MDLHSSVWPRREVPACRFLPDILLFKTFRCHSAMCFCFPDWSAMSSSTEAWLVPVPDEDEDDTHEGGWKRYAPEDTGQFKKARILTQFSVTQWVSWAEHREWQWDRDHSTAPWWWGKDEGKRVAWSKKWMVAAFKDDWRLFNRFLDQFEKEHKDRKGWSNDQWADWLYDHLMSHKRWQDEHEQTRRARAQANPPSDWTWTVPPPPMPPRKTRLPETPPLVPDTPSGSSFVLSYTGCGL